MMQLLQSSNAVVVQMGAARKVSFSAILSQPLHDLVSAGNWV